MPKLYRKKPIVIEAVQYTGDNFIEVSAFLNTVAYVLTSSGIVIRTLEGDMLAQRGDYIIRGMKGEYYPCKPDIFEGTYESV